jgi:hypothetical protein
MSSLARAGQTLAPAGSVTLTTGDVYPAGATLLSSNTITITGVGSVNEAVYRNGGTLDFLYQIVNNSTTTISPVSVNNYSNFTTVVGFLSAAPAQGIPPTNGSGGAANNPASATRSSSPGGQINFMFTNGAGGTGIPGGGNTSAIFYVMTNATAFDQSGTIQTTGATSAGNGVAGGLFEPAPGSSAGVPEPSVVVMGLVGCLVVGGRRYLRRKSVVV